MTTSWIAARRRARWMCATAVAGAGWLAGYSAKAGVMPAAWIAAQQGEVSVPLDSMPEAPSTSARSNAEREARAWPMTLLGADGAEREVSIVQMGLKSGRGTIVVLEGNERRTIDAGTVIALTPDAARMRDEGVGSVSGTVLQLTDGQRFAGGFDLEAEGRERADADAVAWRHPRFGAIKFPLDHVERWERVDWTGSMLNGASGGSAGADPAHSSSDVVALSNGDVALGVVESLGQTMVLAPLRRGEDPQRLSAGDVVRVQLANPKRAAGGMGLWLIDGSVLAVESIATSGDGERLRVRLAGASAEDVGDPSAERFVLPSEVAGIALDRARLMPLSAVSIQRTQAIPPRLYAPRPTRLGGGLRVQPLDAEDLLLIGPARFEFAVLEGARRVRVVGTVELAPEARIWGACTVVVERVSTDDADGAGGRASGPAARIELSDSQPTGRLNTVLEGGADARLRISVESAERGPVHNRVVLKRVVMQAEGR